LEILEKLRRIVLMQYNELNDTITKFTQQFANLGDEDNTQEALEAMMANLPDQIKERLGDKNVNVKEVLNKVKDKKSKRPSTNKQRVREDDASILFDKPQDEEIISIVEQDQEEEITAEPIINETEPHRTDL
jgi:mRNA-degrading endonuclease RelE of RelBE toxin-antitoxin system